jgi:ABC-type transport system substrate-binding protein
MNPPFPIHLWYNTQMPWFADVIDTLKNMAWQVPDKPWQEGMHRPYTAVPYEPELRKLTDQAFAENDPAKRAKLVGQIGQLWNDTAFSLDFAVPVAYYLMKPKLTGFEWYQNGGQGLPLNIEKARVK